MAYLYRFQDVKESMINRCGGKGASLVRLTGAGLPVPQGYVLCADGFDANVVKEDVWKEIDGLLDQLSDADTYAVRSSALNEDGAGASFAGAYETLTDVKKADIKGAIEAVAASANTARVKEYARNSKVEESGIAIVIQKYVKPQFAGVLLTSDILNGDGACFQGNYVKGDGEALVSGASNAETFCINALKYGYQGPDEFQKYGRRMYRYGTKIRNLYGCPMDIEWAVSQGKLYILQARPITTLNRAVKENYDYNGTRAGKYLLTKTNVGEIYMRPLTPATFSMLENVGRRIGMPYFIDNVCGQAYLNLSVIYSFLHYLKFSRKMSDKLLKDLVGTLPEGVEVPIYPYNGKDVKNAVKGILGIKKTKDDTASGDPNRTEKKEEAVTLPEWEKLAARFQSKQFSQEMTEISRQIITQIRKAENNRQLSAIWDLLCEPFFNRCVRVILGGIKINSLFSTRQRIEKIAGPQLATELCSGGLGTLESMKPLLLLEDVMEGKITEAQYMEECGHRHVDEMELALPYPYEQADYLEKRIAAHRASGVNAHAMKAQREAAYGEAVKRFKELYPAKAGWLDRVLDKYAGANISREQVRSKGVRIYCMEREFIKKAGELNGLGEDVFLLYIDEIMEMIRGKDFSGRIRARKEQMDYYNSCPQFPNLIYGRFEPKQWMEDPHRRADFYSSETKGRVDLNSDIKGFAGARGVVEGIVRVVESVDGIEEVQKGEILVTTATNIGWTMVFPKVAAIVTDVGAPLSHAAIVAREFGIPAVVGCCNATTVLKTGDRVIVDGSNGTVRILH